MLKRALTLLMLIPSLALAIPVNSYFNQGAKVNNYTSQTVLITDPVVPQILNYPINSGDGVQITYPADQFTKASGQAFSHTIKVFSGVDYKLICTVISHLYLTPTTIQNKTPTSTDEKHCEPSVFMSMSNGNTIYGFQINVK